MGENVTEYYSYDSADYQTVIEYLMRLVASCTANEIMVRQDNYTYLEPWFNVLKTSLVNKNYSYATDLTYKGV